jgi:Arc/MetJ-type ribon-helix-helix transcriptional regulator
LSTKKIIAMLQNRMPRRKLFEARINLPLTADLLARIDAALRSDEYRVDFVRDAIKRELERREAEQKRRPGAKRRRS